jgi:hypothetical protein
MWKTTNFARKTNKGKQKSIKKTFQHQLAVAQIYIARIFSNVCGKLRVYLKFNIAGGTGKMCNDDENKRKCLFFFVFFTF